MLTLKVSEVWSGFPLHKMDRWDLCETSVLILGNSNGNSARNPSRPLPLRRTEPWSEEPLTWSERVDGMTTWCLKVRFPMIRWCQGILTWFYGDFLLVSTKNGLQFLVLPTTHQQFVVALRSGRDFTKDLEPCFHLRTGTKLLRSLLQNMVNPLNPSEISPFYFDIDKGNPSKSRDFLYLGTYLWSGGGFFRSLKRPPSDFATWKRPPSKVGDRWDLILKFDGYDGVKSRSPQNLGHETSHLCCMGVLLLGGGGPIWLWHPLHAQKKSSLFLATLPQMKLRLNLGLASKCCKSRGAGNYFRTHWQMLQL